MKTQASTGSRVFDHYMHTVQARVFDHYRLISDQLLMRTRTSRRISRSGERYVSREPRAISP